MLDLEYTFRKHGRPRQADETLIKRAVYHYRHELPEQQCFGYREPTRG